MLHNRRRKYRDASRMPTMATPRYMDDETLKISTPKLNAKGSTVCCLLLNTYNLYNYTLFHTLDIF